MKKIIVFFLFAILSFPSFCAEVYWNTRIEGSSVSGGLMSMEDGDYVTLNSGTFTDVSSQSYLRLGLTERMSMSYLSTDTRVRLMVKITPYSNLGVAQSPTTQQLEVIYSPTGNGITVDAEDYRMVGVHKFTAEVTSITVDELSSSGWIPVSSIPSFLYLEAGFSAERYYEFAEFVVPTITSSFIEYTPTGLENKTLNSSAWSSTLASTEEIELSWSYVSGAEYYDLEWTWVDNYDMAATVISMNEEEFMRNSTRVRLGAQSYRIPQTFAKGYLIYRVRGVGRWMNSPTNDKYGQWSSGTSSKTNVSDWPNVIEITSEHESKKNWQYQATYAEDGKKKEVVQYFDGSLRNRQTVTRINSNNQSVVGETVYDNEGRGVVQILPVPQDNPGIHYYPSLNQNANNDPYNHTDFDWETSSSSCVVIPSNPLASNSGAGDYYSTAGHSTDTDWQKNVPDAKGYAYTQVEYTPDNTGKIRNQSGVGADHKLGSGHETYYYYAQPSQEELNRLFGYKVGYKARYKKNMVVDANGQVSVSYLDAQGRVIATAIAGDNMTSFETLPNAPLQMSDQTSDLLNKVNPNDVDTPLDDNDLISTGRFGAVNDGLSVGTQLNVTQSPTMYHLNYHVETGVYQEAGCENQLGVSYPYVYDLIISVKDDCGNEKYTQTYSKIGVEQIGATTGVALDELQNDIPLDKGTYTVYKELRVNEEALNHYLANYLDQGTNPCLTDVATFSLPVESDCEESCQECVENLGTEAEFLTARAIEIYGSNATELNLSTTERAALIELLAAAIEECTAPCQLITSCDSYTFTMINDVSPNGQYGSTNGTDPLSVYTPSNQLGCNWRTLTYNNPDGSAAMVEIVSDGSGGYIPAITTTATVVTTADGLFVTPNELQNLADFISIYQDQWGELFLPYHPEFKLLEYATEICTEQYDQIPTTGTSPSQYLSLSSEEFDSYLRSNVLTFADAMGQGQGLYLNQENYYIDLLNVSNTSFTPIYSIDPYFKLNYGAYHTLTGVNGTVDNNTRKAQLMDYALMTNYNNSTMSMFEYAVRSVIGGYNTSASINSAYNTWSGLASTTLLSTAQKDQIWLNYKSYYLSQKAKINQLFADMYGFAQQPNGIYNGGIGSGELSPGIALSFASELPSTTYNPIHQDIYVKLWGLTFGFPFWFNFTHQPTLLCDGAYNNKQIRITRIDGLNNNSTPVGAQIADLSNQADYAMWQSTGLSPNALDLEHFLNALAQNDRLTQTTDWNNVAEFTPDLYTAVTGNPMTSYDGSTSTITFEGTVVSASSFNLAIQNNGTDLCSVQFPAVGSYSWADYGTLWHIYRISNSYPTSASTVQVLIKAGTGPTSTSEYVVTVTNNCVDLLSQIAEFQNNNSLDADCEKEADFETAMLHLLQDLSQNNQLSSSVSLGSISAYTNSVLPTYFGTNPTWNGLAGTITNSAPGISFSLGSSIPSDVIMVNGLSIVGHMFYLSYTVIDNNLPVVINRDGEHSYFKQEYPFKFLNFNCSCEELNGISSATSAVVGSQTDYDNKLKQLFNHLITISAQNIIIPTGYTCAELDALEPYFGGINLSIRLENPSIYSHVGPNGVMKYYPSFTNSVNRFGYTIDFMEDRTDKMICMIDLDVHMDYLASYYFNTTDLVTLSSLQTNSNQTHTVSITGVINPLTQQPREFIHKYSCQPNFEIVTSEPCVECTPTAQAPVSCTDAYQAYLNHMITLSVGPDVYVASATMTPAVYTNMTEDHFCNLTYAYISSAYIHYLSTAVPSAITNTLTDLRYLTIAEFGDTPIGFSNSDLTTAVDAYWIYYATNPTMGWNEYVKTVYADQNGPLCPNISPSPTVNFELPEEPPCNQWEQNIATVNAQNQYSIYLNQVAETFRQQYIDGAISSVKENFTESHLEKEYHYTLYYYDRAGNLIQTVPPKGVDRLNLTTADHGPINTKRLNDPTATADQVGVAPQHTLMTDYRYNSLNQLVYQNTPDGGESRFAYDKLGRLVVSQNAKQKAAHAIDQHGIPRQQFSYTLYDDLGRVVEVGELTDHIGLRIDDLGHLVYISNPNQLFDVNSSNWINLTSFLREEVTRTKYDELAGMTVPLTGSSSSTIVTIESQFGADYAKDNTRNRIVGVIYQSNYDPSMSVYDNGTFYDYDVHGNVKELIQINKNASLMAKNQHIKHFNYEYDLVSGNVNKVTYQKGQKDQFIHKYQYDSDNRITIAETSKDGFFYEKDAKYFYYDHGPLARTEIGEKKVQAEDYAYTIQGWLKTVNGEQIDETTMLGQDSKAATINSQIAKDAFGYSLSYFDGDYQSADMAMLNYSTNTTTTTNQGASLYNGNIRSMYTALSNLEENIGANPLQTHQTVYQYDQLNRIMGMDGFYRTPTETVATASEYKSRYAYDPNGNITSMQNRAYRHIGNNGSNGLEGADMDDMKYYYYTASGSVYNPVTQNPIDATNRLAYVTDGIAASAYGDPTNSAHVVDAVDIDNQSLNNYSYDQIGQLIGDNAEHIQEIKWTVTNKVKEVIYNSVLAGKYILFDYDAMGHRIAKHSTSTNNETTSTFYVLDAQGNPMSTYEYKTFGSEQNKLYLSDRNIYGSKRVGVEQVNMEMLLTQTATGDMYSMEHEIGDKRYELANMLGNVLNVITDRKLPVSDNQSIAGVAYYTSDVVEFSDFYGFGQKMPNRHGRSGDKYRYGFQGQEKDDEIKGEGNSLNYKYRMYDPRIGRFFAVDPLAHQYPHNGSYNFSENRVLDGVELEGLEVFLINGTLGDFELETEKYSPQLLETNLNSGDQTLAEVFDNSAVFRHTWHGANNTQARMSEADCLFETITANHIEGEAITILGHSHGGNVAILATEMIYEHYKSQGIEVKINLVTLNTPNVVEGGYKLSDAASGAVNWIEVYTTDDKIVPHAGTNDTGVLNEGGEKAGLFGKPEGEFAKKKDFETGKPGSTKLQHPQADQSISYKDKTSVSDVFKSGGFKNIVGHRGWLAKNVKEWLPQIKKTESNEGN